MISALSLFLLVGSAVGLSDGELAQALKGDVPARTESFLAPSGKSAGRGVGAIVIDRPIAEVWTHLSRYEDKAEYQPRVKAVTVLEKQPDRIRARFIVDASIMTAKYTAWFVFDPGAHIIHWTLDGTATDNTIAAADGDYHMFEVAPGQTLVVYRTYIDTGRSIAQSIQNYFTRKAIPNLLRAVKKRIESGGTWKK
jgi:carbon monoxide dehydrogenase subunit G